MCRIGFHRPKIKLRGGKFFEFSVLEDLDRGGRLAPELGFQCIFVKIEVFVTLVPADVSGTPPIDCKVFVGVFGMYSELIGAPVTPPAAENQKIYDNSSRGTSHSMYASDWPLPRQRKVKTQKSSFGDFGRG